jgi:hypothetical protein
MAAENATDERQFAYGTNTYKTCECPAKSAGYNPSDASTRAMKEVTHQFDRRIQQDQEQKTGQVCESVARKVWLDLLETYEGGSMQYRERARITRNIAAKLGWIDE